ncbi:MAG: type 1 glutamine amidotransferase [Alphaproteobacteria bacterium]|nr:type 1 glutamine amidotransferase [Alphaproteobacteria bacterium]
MPRPRIAYTTQNYPYDPLKWLIAFSVFIAGGKPIRVYPENPKHNEKIDGLIIGGGTDVYPPLFKLEPKVQYLYDQPRDTLEIEWLGKAEKENLPVLGICRGAQLINVARGGSLHIDISKVYKNAQYPTKTLAQIFFRKDMNVECGTLLEKILKTQRIAVNSMHSQAVDRVGSGLRICASEDNGVVQAIEDPDKEFFLGVQFHPEALIYKSIFRELFSRFVKAAGHRATENTNG